MSMSATLPARFVVTEDPCDAGTIFNLRAESADECGRWGAPFASLIEKDPTRLDQTRACFAVLSSSTALLALARETLALFAARGPLGEAERAHCERLRAMVAELEA